MNTPPLLLAASLLFWGWQTGLLWAAVPLALALEAGRWSPWRWEISRDGFSRIVDLCGWGFVGLVVYLYLTRERAAAGMLDIQCIPLCYGPLLAAQAYSAQGRIAVGSLFLFLRQPPRDAAERSVDLSYPYFAVCLFSASAANVRTPAFYLGTLVLTGWALWPLRPARTARAGWAAALASAALLGYGGHVALHGLQATVERKAQEWFFGRAGSGTDPARSRTAIGRIGELQQSSGVRLRVRPAAGKKPPELLREASYDLYRGREWSARSNDFHPVPALPDGAWALGPGAAPPEEVSISAALPQGQGLLALPDGTFRVEGLPAAGLSRGGLGAVKVTQGPGLAEYRALFDPAADRDTPPRREDLDVPQSEKPALAQTAAALGLERMPAAAALAAVGRFFQEGFSYSTYQSGRGARPLADFLLRTRRGHCEYFATATVLLLRTAGIPARYAVGWSVQEFSRLEGAYVVRQRHAHAWTLAYVQGRWLVLDTTPASWSAAEAGRASWWEKGGDLWDWCSYRFSRWRWSKPGAPAGPRLRWLLLPLLALLAWRLRGAAEAVRARVRSISGSRVLAPGRDSELYGIERVFAGQGLGRYPWEAWPAWIDRIAPLQEPSQLRRLRALVALHCRYRFDPKGLAAEERRELAAGAKELVPR
ncbi:MAG: transglutaminase-like domain-containing protein [Elusimicrobia bacterium]|nr:transglutaminase-like domain-containing protein [Elusimicrobiota bacterium]